MTMAMTVVGMLDPCHPASQTVPKFHISNMGIGPHDANAIFQYRGTWHAMHQANWTDWAHLVSRDLVRWTRIPSALSPNGDWDGSLTLLDGKPVILCKHATAHNPQLVHLGSC